METIIEREKCQLCNKGFYLAQKQPLQRCTNEDCCNERFKLMIALNRITEACIKKREREYTERNPILDFQNKQPGRPSMRARRMATMEKVKKCVLCKKDIISNNLYCGSRCGTRANKIIHLREDSAIFNKLRTDIIIKLLDMGINTEKKLYIAYQKNILKNCTTMSSQQKNIVYKAFVV